MVDHVIIANLDDLQNKIESWKRADVASARAINDAMNQAKTAASKHTRQKYTIKAQAIRRYEKIDKATPSNLVSKITYRADMTNLINFTVKPSKPMYGKKGTRLKASVQKGQSKSYHPSFVAQGGKLKVPMVVRRNKDNNKIHLIYGPSISMLMNNDDSKRVFTKTAGEAYERRVIYYLGKEIK